MINKYLEQIKNSLNELSRTPNKLTQEHTKYIKKMLFNIELELLKKGELQ